MAGGLSIPEYQTPQVAPTTPLQAPNISSTPDAFGSQSGTQLQQAGARLDQGADALQRWALREQGLHNEAAAKDADAALSNDMRALLFDPTKGYFAQRGRGAIDGAKPTLEAIEQLRLKYSSSLGSPDAQRMFRDVAEQRVRAVNDQVARHVTTETRTWLDQASVARQQSLINDIPTAINDPVQRDKLISAAANEAIQHAIDQGLSPEATLLAGQKARSDGIKIAVLAMSDRDPLAAKQFLDANKMKMDATDVVMLDRTLKEQATHRAALNIVQGVVSTGGNPGGASISGVHADAKSALAARGITLPAPSSETRTPGQNAAVGGAKDSQHLHGNAIDVPLAGMTEAQQQEVLKQYTSDPRVKGVGFYPGSHIHIDTRAGGKVSFGPTADPTGQNWPQWAKDTLGAWKGAAPDSVSSGIISMLGNGPAKAILKLPDNTPLRSGMVLAHGGLPGADAEGATARIYEANPFLAQVQTVGELKALAGQNPATVLASSPSRPNLDLMLQEGLRRAGSDPDLREKTVAMIKTEYATKLAIWTRDKDDAEKRAIDHINGGGTIDNIPAPIRGRLDADSMIKVQAYEEKAIEKKRTRISMETEKSLTDLLFLGQLTDEDVVKSRDQFKTAKEYQSWREAASGKGRVDDPNTYEMIQRGLGTRDMRDDIFSAHANREISTETRTAFLEKNATLMKEGAPATPYKINHDRISRSLSVGIADNPIARELYGKAMKEYDLYVRANPQREGETPEQFSKRLGDYSEDTVKRYTTLKVQEVAGTQPVPAHVPINRGQMKDLPKPDATKLLTAAMQALTKKFESGQITQDQYDADSVVLLGWNKFVVDRPDTIAPPKK